MKKLVSLILAVALAASLAWVSMPKSIAQASFFFPAAPKNQKASPFIGPVHRKKVS